MLTALMTYTQVADGKIIELFLTHQAVPEKAVQLFSHVLNAQQIWACRILGINPSVQVWEIHHPATFKAISNKNFELLAQIIDTQDLAREISYTNSKGDQFVNVVKDILLHVFNHSTYHRAQIASLFKAIDIIPPITDYILLKREGEI